MLYHLSPRLREEFMQQFGLEIGNRLRFFCLKLSQFYKFLSRALDLPFSLDLIFPPAFVKFLKLSV
jgi:hypothetical protein